MDRALRSSWGTIVRQRGEEEGKGEKRKGRREKKNEERKGEI